VHVLHCVIISSMQLPSIPYELIMIVTNFTFYVKHAELSFILAILGRSCFYFFRHCPNFSIISKKFCLTDTLQLL